MSKCDQCRGMCCRYFSVALKAPQTRADYDLLRWYLAHEKAVIYVEDGVWYLQVNTRCRHLDKNYHCDIYSQQPEICRDYGRDACDISNEDYGYELLFTNDAEMAAYMAIVFDNAKQESASVRKRGVVKAGQGKRVVIDTIVQDNHEQGKLPKKGSRR